MNKVKKKSKRNSYYNSAKVTLLTSAKLKSKIIERKPYIMTKFFDVYVLNFVNLCVQRFC